MKPAFPVDKTLQGERKEERKEGREEGREGRQKEDGWSEGGWREEEEVREEGGTERREGERKEGSYRLIFLVITDANVLNKMLAN
jgi:hypothetical protein